MKKTILLFTQLLACITVYTQINCNPDSNGHPCWAGGVPSVLTTEQQILIDGIQEMTIDPSNIGISLPVHVYNFYKPEWDEDATNECLPQIMDQYPQNMCSQASITYYVFTYEINYEQETSALSNSENIFHPSFTYNFLNGGDPFSFSFIVEGINILKENGCPDLVTYGEANIPADDPTKWISGIDKYTTALEKRVEFAEKIDISNINNNNLDLLKYWLFNHNYEPNDTGGIGTVVFENMFGLLYSSFSGFANIEMKYISAVLSTPEDDAHAMTVVGYDDNMVCGPDTGALILANSWGVDPSSVNPENEGYVFLPYALVNQNDMLRKDYNTNQIWVYVLHVNPDYKTDFTLNLKLLLNDRQNLKMSEGFHSNAGNYEPLNNPDLTTLEQFTYGGSFPLLGVNKEDMPLELVLDYSYFADEEGVNIEAVNGFFFGARYPSGYANTASFLQEFYLKDNRCDPPLTISYPAPSSLLYNQWNWFGIDYVRLNEEYNDGDTLVVDETTYCHCQTVISDNTVLQFVSSAAKPAILFHNGEIVIKAGSKLIIGDDCELIANEGHNKITVYGELIIDGSPQIRCESEFTTFEIDYQNPFVNYTIGGGNYLGSNGANNMQISGNSNSLLIENCKLLNTHIEYDGNLTIQQLDANTSNLEVISTTGDLLVQNNELLTDTYISASMPDNNQKTVDISYNNFKNANEGQHKSIISINDYRIFSIDENDIEINHCNGIELYHAGNNAGADKIVSNNKIYSNTPGNECRAIDVFFSRADIYKNEIYDNKYGVVAFAGSETTIMGSEAATSVSNTQQFIDNNIHCYFSYTSYPEDIRYNYFKHNSSITDPYVKLVYYDLIEDPPVVDGSVIYNITYNAWDSEFNGEQDLLPLGSYDYEPYWYPGQTCTTDWGEAGELFEEAKDFIDSTLYSQADSNFREIINDYPDDAYAIHSLRKLYTLEENNGNDYYSLKQYYQSVILANQDSLLCRYADWMSMHCMIMMDSAQNAIDWLDSTINVPQNTVDSIFAIINLGYIYTHYPDSGMKDMLYTSHSQFIPESYDDYKTKREELFESLLKSTTDERMQKGFAMEQNASMKQLAPNPTQNAFTAKLMVYEPGNLLIELYSPIGSKIDRIDLGMHQKGIVEQRISLENHSQGIYYVVLKHNNVVQSSKKLIKL